MLKASRKLTIRDRIDRRGNDALRVHEPEWVGRKALATRVLHRLGLTHQS